MYPAFASYKALSHRPVSESDLERWVKYWLAFGPLPFCCKDVLNPVLGLSLVHSLVLSICLSGSSVGVFFFGKLFMV